MNWDVEKQFIVNTRTGEYQKVDPDYFRGIGLDDGWKWLYELSKTEILDFWARDRAENRIVY